MSSQIKEISEVDADKAYSEWLEEEYRMDIRKGIKSALRDRCKVEGDYVLNRLSRCFYTTKILICVLLRRRPNYDKVGNYPQEIEVGLLYSNTLYAGWESKTIAVGKGIFKNWWFHFNTDGDWYM